MSFTITGDVVTEPIELSQVVSYEFQYLAVYADQRDNWWTAADSREKALTAFERVRGQVKQPLYRVFARWDTVKLKQMADFMAMETPSTAIH